MYAPVTFQGLYAPTATPVRRGGRVRIMRRELFGDAGPVVLQIPISMPQAVSAQLAKAAPRSVLVRAQLSEDASGLTLLQPELHERLAGKVGITMAALIGGILVGAILLK